jgi:hypothetical protein
MEGHDLTRTDKDRYAFIGDEIFHGTTKRDRKDLRSATVRIFRLPGMDYVAGIAHMTCWRGERNVYRVYECKSKISVSRRLRAEAKACHPDVVERYKELAVKALEQIPEEEKCSIAPRQASASALPT